MELIIENDDGEQFTVIQDSEDYINDDKTIVKQVRLAYKFAEEH
jgi:hypothetical protein